MEGIALLSDLKRSRKKASRSRLGGEIVDALDEVSDTFSDHLLAPFEPQRGIDEFGGLLAPGAPVGEILLELWVQLHPHAARFAVSRGTLDVVPEGDERSIHRFDGPALHEATEALGEMDREGALVALLRGSEPVQPPLGALVNLVYFRLLDWTPHQLEIYIAYGELGTQAAVAERFGITQPTVSETLTNIRARFMRRATETMASGIDRALEE